MAPEPTVDGDVDPAEGGAAAAGDLEHPEWSSRKPTWQELARFIPDVGRTLWGIARDPDVAWQAKAIAIGAVAYVASPIDILPDFIPGIGQMDDIYLVAKALRVLFRQAGYAKLREHWPGTDEGFAALLWAAGIRH